MAMKIDWVEAARFWWWAFSHAATQWRWYANYKLRTLGWRNQINAGPIMLCSNHISGHDPALVSAQQYRVVHFVAKKELFEDKKIFKWLIQAYGAFQLDRDKPMAGLKTALKYLKEGKSILIYPEGTRSIDGELRDGQMGAGMIAYKSGARIVPVLVEGTGSIISEHPNATKYPYAFVHFGPEIEMAEYRAMPKGKETFQVIADRMIEDLQKLRDVYRRRYKFRNKPIYD
ncbi:MAG: 1-acyl-sn-glycerol-3-phosphate acyltransferase [bacterium]|nr:1-acyl-sn-glycerol-3-phosphate acyltransferase [bacterium]